MESGKSPRISTPGRPSPRKLPLYSPSELSPFSFNEDTLKILATDIEQQNGLIPLNLPPSGAGAGSRIGPGRCFSQPQTPAEERRSILQDSFLPPRVPSSPLNVSSNFSFQSSNQVTGLSLSHSFGGGGGGPPNNGSGHLLSHSVGASSAGTPGKSMKDYDEGFKEMKKENFNLKLRIFFLEERLGLGKKTNAQDLANANLELKIQLESCKQDLAEKNSLLAEASEALGSLENQIESQKLVIKSYEDKLSESSGFGIQTTKFELGNVPVSKTKKLNVARSPDVSRKPVMSPKFSHKNYFFAQDEMKNNPNSKETVLEILQEAEEISDSETDKCRELLNKIQQLEESLKLSRETQKQLSESLEKSQNDLSVMSNKVKQPVQMEIDMSRLKKTEILFQSRRDCGIQTVDEKVTSELGQDKLIEECHGLKSENKKIRDQLKLQVQERKLLLKKISMLKEQLGSVSETEHKTLPVTEQFRLGTRCVDVGTQCLMDLDNDTRDISRHRKDDIDEKIDNPLSDTSTWNTELPNIADVQLCSSPELLFDCEHSQKPTSQHFNEAGLNSTLIEHLSQQLELYKSQVSAKTDYIANLEEDLVVKEDMIKDQNEAINDYREEILRMEESMYQPKYCPIIDGKRKMQSSSARRRIKFRQRPHYPAGVGVCRDSLDSDDWSEPEAGVSIARIGLPNSYPELGACDCDRQSLLSDDEQKSRLGDVDVECTSNMCLSSGARVLEGLLTTLMHEVDVLHSLDSGIETSDENDTDEVINYDGKLLYSDSFNLCSSCTSSIPKEFDALIKNTHLGLSSAVSKLEKLRKKIAEVLNQNKELKMKDNEDNLKAEEAKTRLNENYILIAKLSSENLRLLGEHSKLESSLDDLKKASSETELKLHEEVSALNGKLFEKEKEIERLQMKILEFERKAVDMGKKIELLQERQNVSKMSPDTSSSFDYFPAVGSSHPTSGSSQFDGFRPRAFSAVANSPKHYKDRRDKDNKLTDVSSPDLGVDLMMESDIYSSLERGNTYKVGSLAFEKIVQENRALRHEREILTQKLGKSKSALQETLLRLSKSNMQKQDQMGSPSVQRRGLTPSRSQGGIVGAAGTSRSNTLERELSFTSAFGTKPKQLPSSGHSHKS